MRVTLGQRDPPPPWPRLKASQSYDSPFHSGSRLRRVWALLSQTSYPQRPQMLPATHPCPARPLPPSCPISIHYLPGSEHISHPHKRYPSPSSRSQPLPPIPVTFPFSKQLVPERSPILGRISNCSLLHQPLALSSQASSLITSLELRA